MLYFVQLIPHVDLIFLMNRFCLTIYLPSTSMARSTIFFMFLSLILIPASTYVLTNPEGFISVEISDKGLAYVKNLLIEKAISAIIPLELPEIEKTKNIPLIGTVNMVLSNITIHDFGIGSSFIRTGEEGVVLAALGATANLSMAWSYSYSTWLVTISDSGRASVQVKGMEIGLTVDLKNQNGRLELDLLDCGCHVNDILIHMDGGASWLYEAVVNAFEWKIASAVEDTISDKLKEAMLKMDHLLQSAPKEIPVKGIGLLNVSFVGTPILSNSSIELKINGLFTAINKGLVSGQHSRGSEFSGSCSDFARMIKISLHENVINSALSVYFNEGNMNWIIDHLPDQALLNTSFWKYIIPRLYRKYPDDVMQLNVSVSSAPVIQVVEEIVVVTIHVDVTVHVVNRSVVTPVACISSEISASWLAEISSDKISGTVKLKEFTTILKWSKIGNLRMNLIQSVIRGIIKAAVVPALDLRLWRGFALPTFQGLKLYNADIVINDSWLTVCSDVLYTQQYHHHFGRSIL